MTKIMIKETSLLKLVCNLDNLLNKLQNYIRKPRKRTKKHIYSWQIFDRYSELIIILLRIDNNLKKYKKYDSFFLKYDKNKDYTKANKWLAAKMQLSNKIQLDIKILYIWTNQIKKIFIELNQNKKKKINLDELDRICLIRHKFIEHISDYNQTDRKTGKLLSPLTRSHQMPYGGFALGQYKNPSIFFQDITRDPKKKKYKKQLVSIISKVRRYLPEIDKQANDLDKVNFIYEHLLLIPKVYRRDAKDLINKVGVRTDSPLKIARELLIAFKEYVERV